MVADKQSCSPENLRGVANELRKLAEQIEAGQVTVGGVNLSICNAVSLKVKQKLLAGQVKFNVSLTASLVGEEAAESFKTSPPQKTKSGKNKPSKAKKESRPYEVKKLKKTLTLHWKEISTAIAASKPLDPATKKAFIEMCQEYGQTAEDDWQVLWQESVNTIKELISMAEEGNFQEAAALVTEVNNQKKSCHKKFK